ncbi:hypothetical protein ATANTOWER_016176 [Ataeniobius toweri]|uniref:Uncharacterized protein n=1 Tax=Ataeniobius toweri TaxID=208326 RepID=A0ABU7A254_9TELE|nr:hypothetical protein [Ataeniobius toweri]
MLFTDYGGNSGRTSSCNRLVAGLNPCSVCAEISKTETLWLVRYYCSAAATIIIETEKCGCLLRHVLQFWLKNNWDKLMLRYVGDNIIISHVGFNILDPSESSL